MPRHSDGVVLSHWHSLFEDFSTSTQEFYSAVEAAVAARNLPDIEVSRVLWSEGGVGSPQREYLRICRQRVAFDICSAPYGNGHFFSWWLAKIPAKYGLLQAIGLLAILLPVWAICMAVVLKIFEGTWFGILLGPVLFLLGIPVILLAFGFAIDKGNLLDEEWVLSIPIIGYLYFIFFNPVSYYRLDTAYMFRDSIASAVTEVINGIREEKGLRALGAEELRIDRNETAG